MLAPIIVLCETYEDLYECEQQTGEIYFTKDTYASKFTFPVVYFRYIDKDSPALSDYDIYEFSVMAYNNRERFLEEYYYNRMEKLNLTPVKPTEIRDRFIEYFI